MLRKILDLRVLIYISFTYYRSVKALREALLFIFD